MDALERELVIELIDRITVHEGGEIDICFKFPDELRRAREFMAENKQRT